MKKLRHRKESTKKEGTGDEDSDDADQLERKSFRIKNSRIKSKAKEESQGNDEYDADSEPDSKLDEESQTSFSHDCSKLQNCDRTKKKKKKKIKDLYQSLQECYVSLKDCKAVLTDSPIKTVQYTKLNKRNEAETSHLDSSKIIFTSAEKNRSALKNEISKHKENITPPESHSTPSEYGKVVRNLDESLFGFDRVEKKLEYSSALSMTETSGFFKSLVTNKEKSLNSKRKYENDEQLGSIDVPMEVCKKRAKRKKNTKPAVEEENHEFWENLRSQFEEVEMHELIIEDC